MAFISCILSDTHAHFPALPLDLFNAILVFVVLYMIAEKGLRSNSPGLRSLNRFLIWFGKNSMIVYVIHCFEYHTTIPNMIGFIADLSENSMIAARAMILLNPLIQVVICILGLYIYEQYKIKCLDENRNSNNVV